MNSNPHPASRASANDKAEYFYDMLRQLMEIGREAGGDALIDATLVAGLLASRTKQVADQSDKRRAA